MESYIAPDLNSPEPADNHFAAQAALFAALSTFQAKVKAPQRTKTGKITATATFKYADLADTWEVIRPVLAETGLAVTQTFQLSPFAIITTVCHKDGGTIESVMPMQSDYKEPKAVGIYIAYMRRYSLQAALGIATEDPLDDVPKGEEPKLATITEEQAQELMDLIEETWPEDQQAGVQKRLQSYLKAQFKTEKVADIPAREFDRVKTVLMKNAPRQEP